MRQQPPQFTTIQCRSCGAIVALMPLSAIVYSTQLRCSQCATLRRVDPIVQASDRQSLLTTAQP